MSSGALSACLSVLPYKLMSLDHRCKAIHRRLAGGMVDAPDANHSLRSMLGHCGA